MSSKNLKFFLELLLYIKKKVLQYSLFISLVEHSDITICEPERRICYTNLVTLYVRRKGTFHK